MHAVCYTTRPYHGIGATAVVYGFAVACGTGWCTGRGMWNVAADECPFVPILLLV